MSYLQLVCKLKVNQVYHSFSVWLENTDPKKDNLKKKKQNFDLDHYVCLVATFDF